VLERDVKKSLKQYLTDIGAYQFWPVPTGFGATTIDCLFCYKGKFYGVECKRPGVDKVTPRQQNIMALIRFASGQTCVESDPELPTVRSMLD